MIVTGQRSAYVASSFLFGLLATIGLATSAGTAYIVYAIIDRRNKHFGRDKALLSSSIAHLQSNTRGDDLKTLINVNSAERDFSTIIRDDHERSGILWGLLAMVPYIGPLFTIIVLQLVSADYRKHATMENIVFEDIDNTARSAGFQPISKAPLPHTIADVSGLVLVGSVVLLFTFAYSFLLLIIAGGRGAFVVVPLCLGALSIITIYSSIESPVAHFNLHRTVEAGLVQSVTS
ncbi:MAG TPA: hypothetical protein VFE98_07805 [Candidatus Bathyarchaeia archaeon]|nr:hypothetical protein [Candidatus Bathyarchaeia archaeon]